MNELVIPSIPAAVVVLLNFFAPYATSLIIRPPWSNLVKKWIAVGVSIVLAVGVMLLAFYGFGLPVPAWPALILLAVVVSQSSYDLILKDSADAVTAATTPNGRHAA